MTYSYDQLWQSSLRLIRVDLGYTIVERDVEAGFVMFEMSEGGRTHRGTLELIRTETAVRVVVQLPSLPNYLERWVIDRLDRKMREELGAPPSPRRPRPTEPAQPAPPNEDTPPGEPPNQTT